MAPDDTTPPKPPDDELRALLDQARRDGADAVRESYARDPRIQRGLALLERYERTRADLADRQVAHDAVLDHARAQFLAKRRGRR